MEIVNNYVQNNYTTIFSNEMLYQIINNYITLNKTTVINETILFEVISNYFKVNYNLFIDETFIQQIINNYITEHQTTIIDIDIVRTVVNNYVKQNITTIFDVDILNQLIVNYFEQNTTIIQQVVGQYSGIIKEVGVKDDCCYITLNNGQIINLPVYDTYALIRDRVQSIVVVPNAKGHVSYTYGFKFIQLTYMVTPVEMAAIIADKYTRKELDVQFLELDEKNNIYFKDLYETPKNITATKDGMLTVFAPIDAAENIKSIALRVKDKAYGGTDYTTSFTPIDQ
jgi:hypothetical protein